MGWNFGDIIDGVASALAPEAPAFIHDGACIRWGEATRATNNVARALLSRGVEPGSRLAIYMRNRPEYLLALTAAWKARLTHVNVNYRYTAPEVSYILDNADSQTVVYGSEFRELIETIQPALPGVRAWIEVCDEGEPPAFAERFDALCDTGAGEPLGMARAPDDQFFIYTGGTTGMPKGVVWTHHDLREIMLAGTRKLGPVPESVEALIEHVRSVGPGPRTLPAPPLMHGTGLLTAIGAMLAGGSVVTLTSPSFDPEEMLRAIDKWRPQTLAIVGDSFGKPLLRALEAAPGKYDLSSVMGIASSGVMWSREVKRGLLAHMPDAVLQDGFSASEAIGLGASVMTRDVEVSTAKFVIGERCRVFDADDRPIEPGSGVRGLIAVGPPNPIGYHKDPDKTARTFRQVDGVRFSFPGDWCLVEADGSLTLLGRGSACINTAGEKVFPEEVEEVLKTHPSVEDSLVVGLPDEKWGQSVTGVVKLSAGAVLDQDALRAHVRGSLAGYKTPKRIIATAEDIRASNGKADYAKARSIAETALGDVGSGG
jgi:acyl-CoA synthetase (AMP-forming)/AMP-acid ligase II